MEEQKSIPVGYYWVEFWALQNKEIGYWNGTKWEFRGFNLNNRPIKSIDKTTIVPH